MKVDREVATRIYEKEARAVAENQPIDEAWVKRVEELWESCEVSNRTFMAMLGTALVAKASNLKIDPFSLKAGAGTPGSYSARTIAQHVLAAHAPRLGIDIGVTGREPLNNQPFFAEARVTKELPVKPNAQQALVRLLECLEQIDAIKTKKRAGLALRSYLFARKKERKRFRPNAKGLGSLTVPKFINLVRSFVNDKSEFGKRAQAVAAGLMDIVCSPDSVKVGRIHDPDQRFPGDVGVLAPGENGMLERSFEVRDKPAVDTDLYHFVQKAAEEGVTKAAVLAVAQAQTPFDPNCVKAWAESEGVILVVHFDWESFVSEILFWSTIPADRIFEAAYQRIHKRAVEMEVSDPGMELLGTLGQG